MVQQLGLGQTHEYKGLANWLVTFVDIPQCWPMNYLWHVLGLPCPCKMLSDWCCSSRPSIQLYPYFSWVSVFCFCSRTFKNALSVALVPNYRANWTWHNYDCIKCQRGLEFTSCCFPKNQLQHPWIWPATFIHIPYPGLTSAYHNSFSNTQGETRPCGAPESHWCTDFPTPLFTDCSRNRDHGRVKRLSVT